MWGINPMQLTGLITVKTTIQQAGDSWLGICLNRLSRPDKCDVI